MHLIFFFSLHFYLKMRTPLISLLFNHFIPQKHTQINRNVTEKEI